MKKIAKFDPQPPEGVIWGSGYSNNHDRAFGVWAGVMRPDTHCLSKDGQVMAQGEFICCPVPVSWDDWFKYKIHWQKIDGEWWWIEND